MFCVGYLHVRESECANFYININVNECADATSIFIICESYQRDVHLCVNMLCVYAPRSSLALFFAARSFFHVSLTLLTTSHTQIFNIHAYIVFGSDINIMKNVSLHVHSAQNNNHQQRFCKTFYIVIYIKRRTSRIFVPFFVYACVSL